MLKLMHNYTHLILNSLLTLWKGGGTLYWTHDLLFHRRCCYCFGFGAKPVILGDSLLLWETEQTGIQTDWKNENDHLFIIELLAFMRHWKEDIPANKRKEIAFAKGLVCVRRGKFSVAGTWVEKGRWVDLDSRASQVPGVSWPGHPVAPRATYRITCASGSTQFHSSAGQVKRKLVHQSINLTYT